MNNRNKIVFLVLILTVLLGCKEEKDDYYYGSTEEFVDSDLLTLLKENGNYSTFLSLIDSYQLDSVINSGKTITVFVPTNEAFETMGELYVDTVDILKYLISESYLNVAQIRGIRQIQTYGKKYANLQYNGGLVYLDDVEITKDGPLCKNGKYYELSKVVTPKPNFYEYISVTNPFYKSYIDLQTSSRLDPFSTIIGFTDDGQAIYDTLWIVENFFEIDFFPVSEELRDDKATIVLFNQEQLEGALDVVAQDLNLTSKSDIPDKWKNNVMMPYLINQSIFKGEQSLANFASGRVKNIQGDSVDINLENIEPEAFVCSNGLAYDYKNFSIPKALYSLSDTVYGTDMVVYKGTGDDYDWAVPDVYGTGIGVNPKVQFNQKLGKDVLNVDLKNINEFSVTITFKNMFPGKYRFLCYVKSSPSGIFQIKSNGEAQNVKMTKSMRTTNKDFIDLFDLRNVNNNRIKYFTGTWYSSFEGFRILEVLVDNITEFGDVKITLEYTGPSPSNRFQPGLILDYLTLERWTED